MISSQLTSAYYCGKDNFSDEKPDTSYHQWASNSAAETDGVREITASVTQTAMKCINIFCEGENWQISLLVVIQNREVWATKLAPG